MQEQFVSSDSFLTNEFNLSANPKTIKSRNLLPLHITLNG